MPVFTWLRQKALAPRGDQGADRPLGGRRRRRRWRRFGSVLKAGTDARARRRGKARLPIGGLALCIEALVSRPRDSRHNSRAGHPRRAALLVAYKFPICALLAPGQPGAALRITPRITRPGH